MTFLWTLETFLNYTQEIYPSYSHLSQQNQCQKPQASGNITSTLFLLEATKSMPEASVVTKSFHCMMMSRNKLSHLLDFDHFTDIGIMSTTLLTFLEAN